MGTEKISQNIIFFYSSKRGFFLTFLSSVSNKDINFIFSSGHVLSWVELSLPPFSTKIRKNAKQNPPKPHSHLSFLPFTLLHQLTISLFGTTPVFFSPAAGCLCINKDTIFFSPGPKRRCFGQRVLKRRHFGQCV